MTAKSHRHKDSTGHWTTTDATPTDLDLTKRVLALEAWRATFPNQPDTTPPPPVEPPPVVVPPPPAGGVLVNSTASLLDALEDAPPLIKVKTGVVLKPLTITSVHGADSEAQRTIVVSESGGPIPVDLGGVSSRGFAVKAIGARYTTFRKLAGFNGNVDQMAVYVIGNGGDAGAPGNVGLTFEDCTAEDTIRGPQTDIAKTDKATAHFCYVSKSASLHRDIRFIRAISKAKGLGAMWHLYAEGSGVTGFVADGWEAYGVSQVVMAYAGSLSGVQLINGYCEGCGTIVRAHTGSGVVTGKHKGTLVRAVASDSIPAWNTSGLVAA